MRITMAVIASLWILAGCTSNHTNHAITDSSTSSTTQMIDKHQLEADQIIYRHGYDNMDRGNHDLESKVAVDLEYYNGNSINREDIVYYQPPDQLKDKLGEHDISRVVGLPGEEVEIRKGQLYINGMLLDAFYGRAHRLGSDVIELKDILKRSDLAEHIRKNIENQVTAFQNSNMEEVEIPENAVFLVGDDWFRSNDSRGFGPIPIEHIKGKVIGEVSD
jgi:signal peptidase I